MAASKKEVAKATSMAAAGKSAQQIQNKTGVSSNRAANIIASSRASNTPMPGSPSMESASTVATPYVAAPSGGVKQETPKYNSNVQQAVATYGDWNKGGAGFGGRDIATLQEQGMSPNQIMKIAASLGNLEGGRINNRANTMLTAGFPNARKGSGGLTDAYFANTKDPFMQGLGRSQGKLPGKVLKWGGITAAGKPLALSGMDFTKDPFGTGKAYTWRPGKGLSADALAKVSGRDTIINEDLNNNPPPNNNNTPPGNNPPLTPIPPEIPQEEVKQDININMPGSPSDIFSMATGWRSKKSRRAGGGAKAQGPASQRVAPIGGWQYNVG
jgi:hypothetical protein